MRGEKRGGESRCGHAQVRREGADKRGRSVRAGTDQAKGEGARERGAERRVKCLVGTQPRGGAVATLETVGVSATSRPVSWKKVKPAQRTQSGEARRSEGAEEG